MRSETGSRLGQAISTACLLVVALASGCQRGPRVEDWKTNRMDVRLVSMSLGDGPADGGTFSAGETVAWTGEVTFEASAEDVSSDLDGISGNRHLITASAFPDGPAGDAEATGLTWLASESDADGVYPFRGEFQLPTRPGRYLVQIAYSDMRGKIANETPGQMAIIDGMTIEVR